MEARQADTKTSAEWERMPTSQEAAGAFLRAVHGEGLHREVDLAFEAEMARMRRVAVILLVSFVAGILLAVGIVAVTPPARPASFLEKP
jgi:hypothetical protein